MADAVASDAADAASNVAAADAADATPERRASSDLTDLRNASEFLLERWQTGPGTW